MEQHNFSAAIESPSAVGILACKLYIPSLYVEQSSLEIYDNVSTGKYTVGLGQQRMALCSDHEDIGSLCLSVLSGLLEETGVHPQRIGRLDVGTETLLDKSKSIKTLLMQLFVDHGNTDIEGVDNINACYGGTAAIFNAIHWIQSNFWDGRYAVVVMGDIAVYAKGNARPTGGAGACALLIGPNAPLVFEPYYRATHMAHAYDFYKPDFNSSYPTVDGQLSIKCFTWALDSCYSQFCKKSKKMTQSNSAESNEVNLMSYEAVLFHTPYSKLVHKAFSRLYLNDVIRDCSYIPIDIRDKYRNIDIHTSINDRDLERDMIERSRELFEQKTLPALYFAQNMGNCYTPSVYFSLFSFLSSKSSVEELYGNRFLLFSYGSGLASSMFSIVCRQANQSCFTLEKLQKSALRDRHRLDHDRIRLTPEIMDKLLLERERNEHKVPFKPTQPTATLISSNFYLQTVDEHHRRKYEKPSTQQMSALNNNNTNPNIDSYVQQLYNDYFQTC